MRGLFAFSLILLIGCGQNTFDSEKELLAYIKNTDNGYRYEKVIGNVVYTLTYRPTDIIVKQELDNNHSSTNVEDLRKKYGDYLYFNLGMKANNQELLSSRMGGRAAFGAMVNQLVFGMGEKVHLISQKRDTIPMADYIYPRTYGMSNSTNILLVYPKNKKLLSEDFFHITIEDLGLSTGEIGFKIPVKPLENEPQINFENTL
ncbi:hypothetical protein [Flagellimonas sp.]|uniref:hypothetical protein n=1 Tax=Flagellimonas sp. TaxID=2058762 RepID=UPI003B5CEABD